LPRVKHRQYFSSFGGLAPPGITFSFLFHQHFFCTLQPRAATSFNTKFEGLSLATVARHRYHLHSP
jgi:hypothetical protein